MTNEDALKVVNRRLSWIFWMLLVLLILELLFVFRMPTRSEHDWLKKHAATEAREETVTWLMRRLIRDIQLKSLFELIDRRKTSSAPAEESKQPFDAGASEPPDAKGRKP
jgi:hypothetical protein